MSNAPGFTWLTPVLCVSDLLKSLDHYKTVLGFEINWTWSDNEGFENVKEPTFACVNRGECSIFLCENCQGNPGTWICLNVSTEEELQQIFEEYKDARANIVEEPFDRSWGMKEMLVKDLDGNVFRIGCQSG